MAGSRKGSGSSRPPRPGGPSRPLNGRAPAPVAPEVSPAVETTTTAVVRKRRVNWRRVLLIGGIALLVLLAGGAGYIYWQVQRTLPTTSGAIKFSMLTAPVTITRDTYGVPHIVAANVKDLYAAQGYVHAQDRLFQMFLFRAVAQGRLAELLSPSEVQTDKFSRTVGFYRAAQAELAQTAPEVRDALQAYANGVNEFIRTHIDSLPLEFGLIGAKMEEWQPVDTLAFGKLEAYDLSQDWANELLASDLRKNLGAATAAQLLPGYPAAAPVIVPGANSGTSPELEAYNKNIRPLLINLGLEGLGSNNWVVAGSKSVTGKPLLANDPHLAVRNPSIWYQMQLTTSDGKYDVTGFSFASAPGIITGHNRNIAWGVTNVGGDVQDLYVEKLDPTGHPGQYQNGDKWVPLQLITETIKVRDAEPVTQTVRLTERGPILSDVFTSDDPLGKSVDRPFSLQWSALKPGRLFEAVYGLQTASNWNEFRAALSKWSVPGQNFVYADQQGNIGYQMTGDYPVRKKGDGSVPVPGYSGEYGWTGVVPYDSLPRAYNPPGGYIATANNSPFPPGSNPPVRGNYAPPYRIQRIIEMLKAKDKLSVDDFKAMQLDTRSVLARNIAPKLAALKALDDRTKQAVAMFKNWDGDIEADSVTASIYEATLQRTLTETLSDDLGSDSFVDYVSTQGSQALMAIDDLMNKPNDPLWDRKDTPQKETRDDILLLSLTAALDDLTGAVGSNMQDWTWGKLHTITPAHPFGGQPIIGGLFNLPTSPIGGDNTTVSVGSFNMADPFAVTSHQSYRMILDTSNWSNSVAIYLNGQSGQPGSKHFGDFLPAYLRGDYNPLLFTPADVQGNKEATLTLQP